jgi:hypothetical protein
MKFCHSLWQNCRILCADKDYLDMEIALQDEGKPMRGRVPTLIYYLKINCKL